MRKSSSANRPPAVRQGTSQTPSNVPITSAVSAWSLIGLKATGELDAGRCELSAIGEHGAHWIAGNLRLDLASLNKVEMLRGTFGGPAGNQASNRPRLSSSCSTPSRI